MKSNYNLSNIILNLLVGRSDFMAIYYNLNVNGTKIMVIGNKNYGICDMKPRIGELLSDFQGRQINDDNVLIRLENAIDEELKRQ